MMSNLKKIIFPLTKDEKIVIKCSSSLNEIDYCYDVKIVFVQNNKQTVICKDSLYYSLKTLKRLLDEGINGNLKLHSSILSDIGFLFNEYSLYICEEKQNNYDHFIITKENGWVGNDYHLWSTKNLVSWMYNDCEGNIIFEITPFYPYMYDDTEKEPQYIPYEEWIKNYQPYLIQKLSNEIAQKWLEQANCIIEQVEKNITQLIAEEE